MAQRLRDWGESMRGRGLSLLVAAVFAVTMNAHAAPPVVDAVAVPTNGSGAIVLIGSKTLVYTPPTGATVIATVRCLKVRKGPLDIYLPPLPTVSAGLKNILGRATANGKTYYFVIASVASDTSQAVQVVLAAGVARQAVNPTYFCGGTSAPFYTAAGVAIYR